MIQLTKKDFIQKLYDIERTEHLKLEKEVQQVVENEIIPMEVIKLINRYDKTFLKVYDTFNTIYSSRNKNLPVSEIAVAVSSLITKILISCTKIEDEQEKIYFTTLLGIDRMTNALTLYCLENNSEKLLECSNEVRDLLEILYCE